MRGLFTIVLLELFLGGGGRITSVGPVSMRMVLFAACLCAILVAVLFPRRRSDGVVTAMILVLLYLLVHVFGLVVGALHGNDPLEMFTEFQQSLFWLVAPFFALMIQTPDHVKQCAGLVKKAGMILALTYAGLLASLLTGLLPLKLLKTVMSANGEVAFRGGEYFIYKGFIYLGIATVFFVATRGKLWLLYASITAVAMVLSFTRGFVISAAVAILLLLFFQGRWRAAVPAVFAILVAAFFVWIYQVSDGSNATSRLETSTNQRIEDMVYMIYHVRPATLIFGEGYGSLINGRYSIENTFLWALWKLGTVGVMFWMVPLGLCAYYYFKTPDRRTNGLANAFMFGTVLVYVQTITNPFLNNPIGLGFVITAIFALRVISRDVPTLSLNGQSDATVAGNLPAPT